LVGQIQNSMSFLKHFSQLCHRLSRSLQIADSLYSVIVLSFFYTLGNEWSDKQLKYYMETETDPPPNPVILFGAPNAFIYYLRLLYLHLSMGKTSGAHSRFKLMCGLKVHIVPQLILMIIQHGRNPASLLSLCL